MGAMAFSGLVRILATTMSYCASASASGKQKRTRTAFKAALSFPDRFRSLVVFPGYSQDGGDDPNLSKLKDIGVSMFVGGLDSGWREASEQTDKTLKALGYTVELHVVEGEPHIIASLTGADLFDAIERVRG